MLNLDTLLHEDPRPERGAEGLLVLLALAADVTASDLERIRTRLAADEVAWTDLQAWLLNWPSPPEEPEDFGAWLSDTEDLGLAHVGLSRLELPETEVAKLPQLLEAVHERLRAPVERRVDHARFAGIAERRLAVLGRPTTPWSWIRDGELASFLDSDPSAPNALSTLAIEADLSARDEAEFVLRLSSHAKLRDAYRERVRSFTKRISITRWSQAWSLDVARNEAELDSAAELLRLHLPHAGGALSVRQHAQGSYWRYPSGQAELVSAEVTAHEWGDAPIGPHRTEIIAHDPSPAEDAWHGVANLMRVAEGEGGPRGLEVARAIAAALGSGPMGQAIASAHTAFETGDDLAREDEDLVSHAFRARLLMSESTRHLSEQGLDIGSLMTQLEEADDAHREHGSAAFMVPDDVHDSLTEDLLVDFPEEMAEWWGHKVGVESAVPHGAIEAGLASLAEPAQIEAPVADNVVSIFSRRRPSPRVELAQQETLRLAAAPAPSLRPDLPSEPCPWLRPGSSERPTPGRVPLVLYDEKNERGIIAELRVHVADVASDAVVWAEAEMLQRIARDSVRSAYRAAAICTPTGVAPHPFSAHRFELVIDREGLTDARVEVDGTSVGLPAALAFASAWSGSSIAERLVAIGAVTRRAQVGAVGATEEKARAALALAGANELEFVVSEPNAAEAKTVASSVSVAEKLVDALAAAALSMDALTVSRASERERLRGLDELVDVVELGDIHRLGEATTWVEVGDRMRHLIESFSADSKPTPKLQKARAFAALAYTHAGLIDDVMELLRGVDRDACTSLETRTLCDIARVSANIDRPSPSGHQALESLSEDITQLRQGDGLLLGRALGTLARAHMHARDLSAALPLFEESIAAHAAHERHEVPRSRMYLGMALRMNVDPAAALEELQRAERELITLTRPYSAEYEESCRTFIDYELARTLVALDRHQEAIEHATAALAASRWRPWPKLGLLRTRAWAHRMRNETALADADVARMREVAFPEPFVQSFVEEAEGFPIDDGEIY